MSGHDANANGAPGSSASADVLDARETMADGPKRLMRLVRAPFARGAAVEIVRKGGVRVSEFAVGGIRAGAAKRLRVRVLLSRPGTRCRRF